MNEENEEGSESPDKEEKQEPIEVVVKEKPKVDEKFFEEYDLQITDEDIDVEDV